MIEARTEEMMINTDQYASPAYCARKFDVPRSTIQSAKDRGEIDFVTFQCGTEMYRVASVEQWQIDREQERIKLAEKKMQADIARSRKASS
ncbi:hypothetical protein KOR42_23620 [Thalassoglobus neptunius]|uniref:Helix-turn-helix domain protein n=1 Tax=Thalassoglobus neptunius TaxID=1938619 RepID=A0A5C5X9W9_9PLAN|nr:hypothetical protein [Thalassoglobus neptunius]TWT58975.1 hypothetical protein KOR42_23620 [Thalassoglobus neptunius]